MNYQRVNYQRVNYQRVNYLLAEVSDASDLEGAGGLGALHLQEHRAPQPLGQAQALQQRGVDVEGAGHGAQRGSGRKANNVG